MEGLDEIILPRISAFHFVPSFALCFRFRKIRVLTTPQHPSQLIPVSHANGVDVLVLFGASVVWHPGNENQDSIGHVKTGSVIHGEKVDY